MPNRFRPDQEPNSSVGNKVGVSHSRMNNNERVEIWNAVKEKDSTKAQYPIMLGARSSLFLPLSQFPIISSVR